MLRSCDRTANACLPATVPMGSFQGFGLGRVVSGSARNEYLLYLRGPGEVIAFAVDLVADVDGQVLPPNFAFAEIERLGVLVQFLLGLVPSIEIFAHPGAGIVSRMERRPLLATRPAYQLIIPCGDPCD